MTHPKALLEGHGLAASKKRGQNFLTQPATAQAIAEASGAGPEDWVVEIGPGLGALTLPLASLARRVIAVEVDRGVHAALGEILAQAGAANVELNLGDALEIDWGGLAARAGRRLVVAGNLPYQITSPLIFNLVEARAAWRRSTLMVQREVAQRLAASPGGKDWGRLPVMVQCFCRVEAGLGVSRRQFHPQPAVDSQVVHLEPRSGPAADLGLGGAAWFGRVVKAAFSQRRKTLANSLSGGLRLERQAVAKALAEAEIDAGRRAETLSITELAQVARAMHGLR